MKIRITSDSTCDLGEHVQKRDIGIMPLQVNLGDKAYRDGLFDKVFTTNLVYRMPELKKRDWYCEVELSKYLSKTKYAKLVSVLPKNEGDTFDISLILPLLCKTTSNALIAQ